MGVAGEVVGGKMIGRVNQCENVALFIAGVAMQRYSIAIVSSSGKYRLY